jgi:apolipoprotein N-acyltransferase
VPEQLLAPGVGANGRGTVVGVASARRRGGALVAAVLSGLMLTAAFPSLALAPLGWVGLVPVLLAAHGRTPRAAFGLGWLTGITFFVGTCYWIVNTIAHFTNVPWVISVVLLFMMSAVLACYHGAFVAGVRWLEDRGLPAVWLAPALWVTLEWMRGWFFIGFPWARLGDTQYPWLDLIQFIELTGVYGMSAVLAFANVVIAAVLRERGYHVRRHAAPLVVLTLLVVVLPIGGHWRRTQIAAMPPAGQLRVGIAQGNVEQESKWDPAFQAETLRRYRDLTLEAARQHPDLIAWPETATPFFFQEPGDGRDEVLALVAETGIPLLTGIPAYGRQVGGGFRQMNRAVLIAPDGDELGSYDKIQLVPFGEYVPFSQVLFFVDQLVTAVGQMTAGTEYTVFQLPDGGVRFGVLICYEGIFPSATRRFVADGAQFLVNVTNDAWYGRTSAPHQHLAQGILRTIENRVPMVRSANTGISAFVDATGQVIWQGPLYETLAHVETVSWPGVTTFYARFGDVFVWGCAVVTALAVVVGWRRRRA